MQFHFHTPSEEKVGGMPFPMVAHFVHKNAAGNLAIVAVLFKQGKHNPALAEVLDTLPAEGETQVLDDAFDPHSDPPQQAWLLCLPRLADHPTV